MPNELAANQVARSAYGQRWPYLKSWYPTESEYETWYPWLGDVQSSAASAVGAAGAMAMIQKNLISAAQLQNALLETKAKMHIIIRQVNSTLSEWNSSWFAWIGIGSLGIKPYLDKLNALSERLADLYLDARAKIGQSELTQDQRNELKAMLEKHKNIAFGAINNAFNAILNQLEIGEDMARNLEKIPAGFGAIADKVATYTGQTVAKGVEVVGTKAAAAVESTFQRPFLLLGLGVIGAIWWIGSR